MITTYILLLMIHIESRNPDYATVLKPLKMNKLSVPVYQMLICSF